MADDSISARLAAEAADGTLNLDRAAAAPAIPAATSDDLRALRRAVLALKQTMDLREGRSASVLDKALTLRDLVAEGVLSLNVGSRTFGGAARAVAVSAPAATAGGGVLDSLPTLATPPTPTDLKASAALNSVLLLWALAAYANHAYCEVWRASAALDAAPPALGSAVLIGTTDGVVFLDASTVHGVAYYYWVRAVNDGGTKGAFNDVAGVKATLSEDVDYLLTQLAGQITETQLDQALVTPIRSIVPRADDAAEIALRAALQAYESTQAANAAAWVDAAARAVAARQAADALLAEATARGVAILAEQTARLALDGAVSQLYTLRAQVSAGGRTMVGGFGLSATATAAGGAEIDFGVRADRFWVGAPSDGSAPGIGDAIPFYIQTVPITVNGVTAPAGTYIADAMIRNGSVVNAKIGNAAIDDAKISNLSAAKITAGTIDAARIGAGTITADKVSVVNLAALSTLTGALSVTGDMAMSGGSAVYAGTWPSGHSWTGHSGAGFHLSADGLMAGDATTHVEITSTGDITAPQFSIASGNATFAGSLNVKSAAAGARMEITNARIRVFDSGGVERVRIGDLS